jgi:hypothetical protein
MNTQIGLRRPRALFWPILLIVLGVLWLLNNAGIISGANLAILFRLWPVALIVAGAELLLLPNQPRLAALVSIGALVGAIGLALVGPAFGWGKIDVKNEQFNAASDSATSAEVVLSPAVSELTVTALDDSAKLIDANVNYIGKVEFNATGDAKKVVTLRQSEGSGVDVFSLFNKPDLSWKVGLTPSVPLDLRINSGVGETKLDLTKLNLTKLNVDAGVGEIVINLPGTESKYDVNIHSGVGEIQTTIPEGAALTLKVDGGTGDFTVDVPDGAAVQVKVKSGLGDVKIPANFTRTAGGDDKSGTWETANFASATRQIVIEFNAGIGEFTVR